MPVTAIPRFFPCRRKAVHPVFQAEFIRLDSETSSRRRALLMHTTREAAQKFIERSGRSFEGWIVGYVGYDVMPMWLMEAAGLHEIDCVVVDKTAPDVEPTLVLPFEKLLVALESDSNVDDEIAVDGELCAM